MTNKFAIRVLPSLPLVHGPILVEIVIGFLNDGIDAIKSLEEIALPSLVLPDKRGDLIGIDPTRINHVTEVRNLKPFELHPPLTDRTIQSDRTEADDIQWLGQTFETEANRERRGYQASGTTRPS